MIAVTGEVGVGIAAALGRLDDGKADSSGTDRAPADLRAAGMLPGRDVHAPRPAGRDGQRRAGPRWRALVGRRDGGALSQRDITGGDVILADALGGAATVTRAGGYGAGPAG